MSRVFALLFAFLLMGGTLVAQDWPQPQAEQDQAPQFLPQDDSTPTMPQYQVDCSRPKNFNSASAAVIYDAYTVTPTYGWHRRYPRYHTPMIAQSQAYCFSGSCSPPVTYRPSGVLFTFQASTGAAHPAPLLEFATPRPYR